MACVKAPHRLTWHSFILSDALKPQELVFLLTDFTKCRKMCNRLSLKKNPHLYFEHCKKALTVEKKGLR